jgi:hypothetical protein
MSRFIEDPVALATLVLAVVTVAAIVTPLLADRSEARRRRAVALAQLTTILRIFEMRISKLRSNPRTPASQLNAGLAPMFDRSLEGDIAEAVPETALGDVYLGLYLVTNVLSYAAELQADAQGRPDATQSIADTIGSNAEKARAKVKSARQLLGDTYVVDETAAEGVRIT